jgi:hypothetical protein
MEILKDLARLMSQAVENPDGEEFNRLSSVFQNRKSAIREKIQAMTSKEVKGIVKKLAEGVDLTEEEMGLVKLWIVGDAEAYAKMESKFEDWIAEFKKLESLMKEQEAGSEEVQDLFWIQGILEDASRFAINIGYYLETIERIRRFEEATANPALMDRDLIVKILKLKFASPETLSLRPEASAHLPVPCAPTHSTNKSGQLPFS